MSRYNTQVLSSIRMLCRMQNIDEKVLYERAKLILSIYREVCWSTIDRANDVCDTLICTYGDSLDGALIYLENFAPDEARERFEERIRSLSDSAYCPRGSQDIAKCFQSSGQVGIDDQKPCGARYAAERRTQDQGYLDSRSAPEGSGSL